jgi:hypothetical protein
VTESHPHVIDPHAVYTAETAAEALDLRKECLPREIRLGRLEARQRAGRYYILGQWLLDWFSTGRPHRRWEARAGPQPAGGGDNGRRRVKPR